MPLPGAVRRLVLAPSLRSVTFAARGFPVTTSQATRRLEAIPQAVVCGFEWGIEARGTWELARRLELVDPELRGFAYEGAAMAAFVHDAMTGRRARRTQELLTGPARPHLFLAYIGIGFAMARLPRALWRRALPHLEGVPQHPTMSWLVIDGYGFDLAYFRTLRFVDRMRRPRPYPWLGRADYFPRAVDQGIGRALWFVHGADVRAVARTVARFDVHRQADLWSGVGIAAAVAGGASPEDLTALVGSAGEHHGELALGAVFAATARSAAGSVPEHTEIATRVFTGGSVADAVRLGADAAVAEEAGTPDAPAYEMWRAAIRAALRPESPPLVGVQGPSLGTAACAGSASFGGGAR